MMAIAMKDRELIAQSNSGLTPAATGQLETYTHHQLVHSYLYKNLCTYFLFILFMHLIVK